MTRSKSGNSHDITGAAYVNKLMRNLGKRQLAVYTKKVYILNRTSKYIYRLRKQNTLKRHNLSHTFQYVKKLNKKLINYVIHGNYFGQKGTSQEQTNNLQNGSKVNLTYEVLFLESVAKFDAINLQGIEQKLLKVI